MEEEHFGEDKKRKLSFIEKAKEVAGATGKAVKDGFVLAGKGSLFLVKGGFKIGGKVVEGGLLIKDKALRERFGFLYFQALVKENYPKLKEELSESKDLAFLLWKASKGHPLTKDEKHAAKEQLKDLARVIPALGIFALPGGAILLPILGKVLPWSFLPSAFRKKEEDVAVEDICLAAEVPSSPAEEEKLVGEEESPKGEGSQEISKEEDQKSC